jgi:hypothetical protein
MQSRAAVFPDMWYHYVGQERSIWVELSGVVEGGCGLRAQGQGQMWENHCVDAEKGESLQKDVQNAW